MTDYQNSETIKHLIYDSLHAGHYLVSWDGFSSDSIAQTNGIYHYVLTIDTIWAVRSLFLNTVDPLDFKQNNCYPLTKSDYSGKIEIDYKSLALNEQIRLMSEEANNLGVLRLPTKVNLVFIKDQYQLKTVTVDIYTTSSFVLDVVLEKE